MRAQHESGQIAPRVVKRRKQHCPLAAVQRRALPHSVMAITVMPAAPISPSPPRIGAMPARPRPDILG